MTFKRLKSSKMDSERTLKKRHKDAKKTKCQNHHNQQNHRNPQNHPNHGRKPNVSIIFWTQRPIDLQGVAKNVPIECCWNQGANAQSPVVGTTWAWKVFFGRFLLRLSRIKRLQVMSMVKFSPTALNFGYDSISTFFGTPCRSVHLILQDLSGAKWANLE